MHCPHGVGGLTLEEEGFSMVLEHNTCGIRGGRAGGGGVVSHSLVIFTLPIQFLTRKWG